MISSENDRSSRSRNLIGPSRLSRNRGRSFSSLTLLDLSANPRLSARDLERFAVLGRLELLLASLPEREATSGLGREFREMFQVTQVQYCHLSAIIVCQTS